MQEGRWCATHKQSWHTLGKSCCQRMCRKEGGPSKTVRMELNITVEIKGDYKNKTNGLTLSSFFRNSKTIVTLYCSLESVMLEFLYEGNDFMHGRCTSILMCLSSLFMYCLRNRLLVLLLYWLVGGDWTMSAIWLGDIFVTCILHIGEISCTNKGMYQ